MTYIAENIRVLESINGIFLSSCIKDGDYGILVRQPCIWSGGIQPVKIAVTPVINEDTLDTWDVNSSIRLPLSMCKPYAADYDGGEMTIFIVHSPKAVLECQWFSWPHEQNSPHITNPKQGVVSFRNGDRSPNVKLQAMCTTTCWTDRTQVGYVKEDRSYQ